MNKNELKMITKPIGEKEEIWFYKQMVKKLKQNEEWVSWWKNYDHKLYFHKYDKTDMWSNPTIVFEVNKEIDCDDFFVWRGFLFDLLEKIEPKYDWGICRSNQLTKCFSNIFEIHPSIKKEHSIEGLYGNSFKPIFEIERQIKDLKEELSEMEKERDLLNELYDEQKLKEDKIDLKMLEERIKHRNEWKEKQSQKEVV